MAKAILPTNFQDDILDSSMDGKRRYKQTTNADGTVSLEDASTYDQVGSNFGASQLNAISKAVNESADSSKIISDPDTASATTEQGYIADVQLFNQLSDSLGGCEFSVESDGAYVTYIVGADTVTKKLGEPTVYSNTYTEPSSGGWWYASSLDIKSSFPDIYKDLVLYKNLFPVIKSYAPTTGTVSTNGIITFSYDSSTGILSFTHNSYIYPNQVTVYMVV